MRKAIGLRTEIIGNISLLLGAALFFSGFLLLKVAEEELLEQRVQSISGFMNVIAHTLLTGGEDKLILPEVLERSKSLLGSSAENLSIESWGLVGEDLGPVFFFSPERSFQFDMFDLGKTKKNGKQEIQIYYSSNFFIWTNSHNRYVLITVPIMKDKNFEGALQARFSLDNLMQRISEIQKIILIYMFLFGAIIISFAIYLLGRRVIMPMQRFLDVTQQIAAGNLEKKIPVDGPHELSELSVSINAMTSALLASRRETEIYIQSLEETNLKLEQTRDELVRSEKMASIGHLAAGMAHEIGNPLGAALGYLEFLKTDLPQDNREIAERATCELERIDRLVKDLLDYAVPGSDTLERLDIAGIVKQAIELLSFQGALDGIIIKNDLPNRISEVFASRHKLMQVFINLMLNSRDVLSSEGVIYLNGGEKEDEIWISLEDTGPGIPKDILSHIFDPFFTTKDPGKGRGLGLSICQRIIEEIDGRISVESNEGHGSRFVVRMKKAGVENG